MDNNEKKQSRRTIFLTVGCGALATAGIIFFILGLLKFNQASRYKEKIIYVTPEFDPTGDEAEENAKVDLVQAQMMLEDKNQLIERVNVTKDISEATYLGEDLYAYEFEYVNEYGKQRYSEILWAENNNMVKRFVGGHFVGYTFNVDDKAYDYVQSKQLRFNLNAYTLDFESNNGATSLFTSSDESINEFYAHYTRQEYDPENLQLYHIGLYIGLGYITITPEVGVQADVDFLVIQARDHGDYDDMPDEWGFNDNRYASEPQYSEYARIPYYFLIGEGQYAKYYVQPKNGAYGYMNNYHPSDNYEDDMWEWYLGFVATGDTREDFIQNALTTRGYTYDSVNDEYTTTEEGWRGTVLVKYTHHVKVSYKPASETPSFQSGLMLIDSSRTWEPVE